MTRMIVHAIGSAAVAAILCLATACATTPTAPELAGADLKNGEYLFHKCTSCHNFTYHMTGPNLTGVFGQPACRNGSYTCSDALAASGIVWDYASLDRYLENPQQAVPNTKMTFAGVHDPNDRRDLIAFIARNGKK